MHARKQIALATTATTTLGLALGAGFLLGRTGGDATNSDDRSTDNDKTSKVTAAAFRPTTGCDEVLDAFVDRGLEKVGAYGWDGDTPVYTDMQMPSTQAEMDSPSSEPTTGTSQTGPTTDRSTSSDTGTNVQETGVDEPDVVKVKGSLLVRVSDDEITTYDVSGAEPERLGRMPLPDMEQAQALLDGNRLVVLGTRESGYAPPETVVATVSLADPGSPALDDTTTYTGRLSEARLSDGVVRIVLTTHLPYLDFVSPGMDLGERSAAERNSQVVRDSTLEDWLPTVDGELAVECEDVAVPLFDGPIGATTVLSFEPGDPLNEGDATAVAAAADTAYLSQDRLVLAAPENIDAWMGRAVDCLDVCGTWGSTTMLYTFALDGTDTSYTASGEVDGSIRDRWAMDFADDTLRVALGPTTETGNFNSVVAFREEDGDLVESGRVDKLGVNEYLESVRWFDDLAIVVTFRKTDPLYAIDLSDPDAPRLIGKLKIPGFSQYLHPLGERRLLGIGQSATSDGAQTGAQAAVFDVTDLTSPKRLAVANYGVDTYALAAADPRQFVWLPEQRTALTVIAKGWNSQTGYVSRLRLDGGPVENKMVEVEHGADVTGVRLVPLTDGRVVLITDDDVSFFEV